MRAYLACMPPPHQPAACSSLPPSATCPPQKLYFCEYSLDFFKRRSQLLRHLQKCPLRHPPGDEIYRNGGVSMFEVRGRACSCRDALHAW